jgi:hypothetical protein
MRVLILEVSKETKELADTALVALSLEWPSFRLLQGFVVLVKDLLFDHASGHPIEKTDARLVETEMKSAPEAAACAIERAW